MTNAPSGRKSSALALLVQPIDERQDRRDRLVRFRRNLLIDIQEAHHLDEVPVLADRDAVRPGQLDHLLREAALAAVPSGASFDPCAYCRATARFWDATSGPHVE
jgi:hypothetical protein